MTITEETAGQFLERVGTNGMLWAEEMHKRFPSVPPDDLLGWCCNMIEAGRNVGHRSSQQEFSQLKGLFAIIVNLPDEVTIAEVKQTMKEALEP